MRKANGCGLVLGMAWALGACGNPAASGPASGAPVKADVSGSAQKGPFSNGSQVSISELDVHLVQTGRTFSTTMSDDGGGYSVRGVQLDTPYARVEVNGFYFDEVRGQLSASPLSIFSYVDLSDRTTSNINLLGHLEATRLEHLVAEEGVSFSAAKIQAHREVLEMFQLDPRIIGSAEDLDISQPGAGNAALFAISVMLQGTRTVAELSELLSNIQSDLSRDGTLDDAANGSALMAGATTVDLARARENLAGRFEDLGVDATVPDIAGDVSRFADAAPYVYTGGGISYPIGFERPNLLDPGMARFAFDGKYQSLGFAYDLPEGSQVKIRITNHTSNEPMQPTSIWYFGANSVSLDWAITNYDWATGVQEFTSRHAGHGDLDLFGFMGSGSATLEYFESDSPEPTRTKEIAWSDWQSFGGPDVSVDPRQPPPDGGTGGNTSGSGGAGGTGSGGAAGYGGAGGDPHLPPDDPRALCGNGVIDQGEECDGGNLNGATCDTYMPGTVGELGCDPSVCHLRSITCDMPRLCGNGVIDEGEDCDGANLDGMTCADYRPGFIGELSCEPNVCRFNDLTCERACGNGVIDAGEECDGSNLNGATCETLEPNTSGEVRCSPSCTVMPLTCQPLCGNGVLDQGEACDFGMGPVDACTDCNPDCEVAPLPCP